MNIEQLRLGDIQVYEVPKRGVIGRIECLFIRYGHASIYVGNGDIVESIGRGAIRTGLLDNYSGRQAVILRYSIPWMARNAAMRAVWISRCQSAKYDYKALADVAIPRVLAQKMGLRLPKLWRRNDRYICSELVLQAYQDVGVDLGCTPQHQIALPGDFLNSPALKIVYRGKI